MALIYAANGSERQLYMTKRPEKQTDRQTQIGRQVYREVGRQTIRQIDK